MAQQGEGSLSCGLNTGPTLMVSDGARSRPRTERGEPGRLDRQAQGREPDEKLVRGCATGEEASQVVFVCISRGNSMERQVKDLDVAMRWVSPCMMRTFDIR